MTGFRGGSPRRVIWSKISDYPACSLVAYLRTIIPAADEPRERRFDMNVGYIVYEDARRIEEVGRITASGRTAELQIAALDRAKGSRVSPCDAFDNVMVFRLERTGGAA